MKWLALAMVGATLVGLLTWEKPAVATFGYMTDLDKRTVGQRHNARLAANKLNGAVIPPGGVFSFNQRVGSYSKDAGFRVAPVSYSGILVPDWGGGVCQTSTTLYNAALVAGLDILEHFHHEFSPTYAPPGLDAAVAYPGVDLRFRNPFKEPLTIVASASGRKLRVQIVGGPERKASVVEPLVEVVRSSGTVHLPSESGQRRVRNAGQPGYNVTVYRINGDGREQIDSHSFPPAQRVIED